VTERVNKAKKDKTSGHIRNRSLLCYSLLMTGLFIFQADVFHTAGGDAQVFFNDVERLKQQSPTATPSRKRSASTDELEDTEAACAVSVEGHKRARH
jgi:hypothetical protein